LMSKKNFIHQANEKMDEAIIQTFLQIVWPPGPSIMPMSIHELGNAVTVNSTLVWLTN
jgi:3-oxoacyl-[acyl-carrier-protein] synthase-3